MKKEKITEQGDKNIVAVEEALSKSEQFIERNQNMLIGVVAAIVLIIGGYIGYNRFILQPREDEARSEMFMAEKYFEQDSLQLALEGDGSYLGFLDIISDYKMTQTANLAKYYAGVAYLNLGEYENAIDHLKKYNKKDQILGSMAYGAIADAYLQLEDTENAIGFYRKASKYKPNDLTTPAFLFKLGMTLELTDDKPEAIKAYTTIKNEYPTSTEARNIDKYIARASVASNQ